MVNAKENFSSLVQGHLHHLAGVNWYANGARRIFGVQAGCLLDHESLAMAYGTAYNQKPILVAAVVIDGTFPYWEPMLL